MSLDESDPTSRDQQRKSGPTQTPGTSETGHSRQFGYGTAGGRRALLALALAALIATGVIASTDSGARRSCPTTAHVSLSPGARATATEIASRPEPRATILPASAATLTVGRGALARPIPAGFLGLSFEFDGLLAYMGEDQNAVNPVLEQLIRDLTPGQRPVLRIGGDSTDWTWWPVPGVPRPPGVT